MHGNSGLRTIGKYQLLRRIGKGGMGSVYQAKDLRTGNIVALKLLNEELRQNREALLRLEREIVTTSRLKHPAVIRVYEPLRERGSIIGYAMEYFQGVSLYQYMQKHYPLSNEILINLFIQILQALQEAHSLGIVHRDIQYGNVLTNGKQAKLIDFGIAKVLHQRMDLTKTGSFVGTPAFASPELIATPKNIDHRTDIYALGVLLYYMIENKLPFQAETVFLMQRKILQEPFPFLTRLREFDKIIQKATRKNPDERYNTLKELSDEFYGRAFLVLNRGNNVSSPEQVSEEEKVLAMKQPTAETSKKNSSISSGLTAGTVKKFVETVKKDLAPEREPVRGEALNFSLKTKLIWIVIALIVALIFRLIF